MGIIKSGFLGGVTGRIGDLTFYIRKGKTVVRKRYRIKKPATLLQKISRKEMEVTMEFLSALTEFIRVGFAEITNDKPQTAFNAAVSYTKKQTLTGNYPAIRVNYPVVMLSKGTAAEAFDPEVMPTEAGLRFNWQCPPQLNWPADTDQVMMLAYFPLLKIAVFILAGAMRKVCTDVLPIPDDIRHEYMEVYISFVSNNRRRNADSTYLRSFNQAGH